jgi:hypothetical protein
MCRTTDAFCACQQCECSTLASPQTSQYLASCQVYIHLILCSSLHGFTRRSSRWDQHGSTIYLTTIKCLAGRQFSPLSLISLCRTVRISEFDEFDAMAAELWMTLRSEEVRRGQGLHRSGISGGVCWADKGHETRVEYHGLRNIYYLVYTCFVTFLCSKEHEKSAAFFAASHLLDYWLCGHVLPTISQAQARYEPYAPTGHTSIAERQLVKTRVSVVRLYLTEWLTDDSMIVSCWLMLITFYCLNLWHCSLCWKWFS